MLPLAMSNLLEQAKQNQKQNSSSPHYKSATIFTPNEQLEVINVNSLNVSAKFFDQSSHHELIIVNVRLQPGVYNNKVLPYKDKLIMELGETSGLNTTIKKYTCVPLKVNNYNAESNNSNLINLEGVDNNNFIDVDFQLIDPVYNSMKNVSISGVFNFAKVEQVLHHLLTKESANIKNEDSTPFKGVNIQSPIDNEEVYSCIVIKQGTDLVHISSYIQQKYGVYSSGIGSFYKDGYWYVFSTWDSHKYDNTEQKLDLYRIPRDHSPTLEKTYFKNGLQTTILITGDVKFSSKADINHQNVGTGQQIISSDAIAGNAGNYYNNGRSVVTREDSMTEFRTVERGSGEINDKIKINPKPTNNIYREMSAVRSKDGELVTLQWDNSDITSLFPGMPVKYFYLDKDQILLSRKGTLIGYSYSDLNNSTSGKKSFNRMVKLIIFLGLETTEE